MGVFSLFSFYSEPSPLSEMYIQTHYEFWSRTESSAADLKSASGPLILSKNVPPLPTVSHEIPEFGRFARGRESSCCQLFSFLDLCQTAAEQCLYC